MSSLKAWIVIFVMYAAIILQVSAWGRHEDAANNRIITAIKDNGCATPTQIEIKPDLSNAEAYNYDSFKG